jgi:hypothetical protein
MSHLARGPARSAGIDSKTNAAGARGAVNSCSNAPAEGATA